MGRKFWICTDRTRVLLLMLKVEGVWFLTKLSRFSWVTKPQEAEENLSPCPRVEPCCTYHAATPQSTTRWSSKACLHTAVCLRVSGAQCEHTRVGSRIAVPGDTASSAVQPVWLGHSTAGLIACVTWKEHLKAPWLSTVNIFLLRSFTENTCMEGENGEHLVRKTGAAAPLCPVVLCSQS